MSICFRVFLSRVFGFLQVFQNLMFSTHTHTNTFTSNRSPLVDKILFFILANLRCQLVYRHGECAFSISAILFDYTLLFLSLIVLLHTMFDEGNFFFSLLFWSGTNKVFWNILCNVGFFSSKCYQGCNQSIKPYHIITKTAKTNHLHDLGTFHFMLIGYDEINLRSEFDTEYGPNKIPILRHSHFYMNSPIFVRIQLFILFCHIEPLLVSLLKFLSMYLFTKCVMFIVPCILRILSLNWDEMSFILFSTYCMLFALARSLQPRLNIYLRSFFICQAEDIGRFFRKVNMFMSFVAFVQREKQHTKSQ